MENFFIWVSTISPFRKILAAEGMLIALFVMGGISLEFTPTEIIILTLTICISVGVVFDFLPSDKQGHFLMGLTSFTVSTLLSLIWLDACTSVLIGVIVAVVVGVGKELYDLWMNTYRNGHHGVEAADALATMLLPVVLGLAYIELCHRLAPLIGV